MVNRKTAMDGTAAEEWDSGAHGRGPGVRERGPPAWKTTRAASGFPGSEWPSSIAKVSSSLSKLKDSRKY